MEEHIKNNITTANIATGRRKVSVARVRLAPGSGQIIINNVTLDKYFPRENLRMIIKQPLEIANCVSKYDVFVNVNGGGNSGQAGAIRHGIARAIALIEEGSKPGLRKGGYLTRDPRMKERKKFAHKGARKRFQFSKR